MLSEAYLVFTVISILKGIKTPNQGQEGNRISRAASGIQSIASEDTAFTLFIRLKTDCPALFFEMTNKSDIK